MTSWAVAVRWQLEEEVLANGPGRTIPELVVDLGERFGRNETDVRRTVQRLIDSKRLGLDVKMRLSTLRQSEE